MLSKKFLPLLRALSDTFQAFEMYSASHIRSIGLTPPQFDIIATLGNTAGMSPKELGEKTLITKGTLTGVVDRLIDKGLVSRTASATDGRCQHIQLTREGERLFARIFPEHLDHLRPVFERLSVAEIDALTGNLAVLRNAFDQVRPTQE